MYIADEKRYETMKFRASGKSGLKLPEVVLGLWHNFGDTASAAAFIFHAALSVLCRLIHL